MFYLQKTPHKLDLWSNFRGAPQWSLSFLKELPTSKG